MAVRTIGVPVQNAGLAGVMDAWPDVIAGFTVTVIGATTLQPLLGLFETVTVKVSVAAKGPATGLAIEVLLRFAPFTQLYKGLGGVNV